MIKLQEPKYDAVPTRGDNSRGTKLINRATGEAIPDEEPVFIFRARDVHALETLIHYQHLCQDEEHRAVVEGRMLDFQRFKHQYPDRMKEPDTAPLT